MWTSLVRSLTDSRFKMSVFRRNTYRSKDAITENKSCHTCSATNGEFLRLWTCAVWSSGYCATHITQSVTCLAQHYFRNFRHIMKFCRHENCGAVFRDVGSYSQQICITVPKGTVACTVRVGEGQITCHHVTDDGKPNSHHRQKRQGHKCAVHFLSSCTEFTFCHYAQGTRHQS